MNLQLDKFSVKSINSNIFTTNFRELIMKNNNHVKCLKNLPKRFIFYDGDSLPIGFFFTYYGFMHSRRYDNQHIADLLLVHEFSHFNRFTKIPSNNYVEWSDKMMQDEYDASVDSEMLIYYTGKSDCGLAYRYYTFNHPILFDKLKINNILDEHGKIDVPDIENMCRKFRDKAIYSPKGFIEEQIQNYQKSNRYWCSLYAKTYKKLESFNIEISNKTVNPNITDADLLKYFLENIQEIINYTDEPIERFEEYYTKVNETYGNYLYDL